MTIPRTRRMFGKRVREFHKTRGYSQEQLADKAGLHRTYIGSIERGEQNISIDNSKDIILDDMNDIERDLAVMLLRFPQVVVKAYEGFKPNLIADYLFDLAKQR